MLLSAGMASADATVTAAKPPEFQPVPVRLFQQRDGLGHVFAKLKAGKEVRIAYFGGSITAADGWRPQTLQWFRDTYPQAQIKEINAAIGGTGSDLGVYRFGQDVLAHKPDLIFVEFAVNDGGASPENIWRGMEGIVRQTWKADPTIDICYVYTFHTGQADELSKGINPRAASAMEMLAAHHGIASINVASRIVELSRAGALLLRADQRRRRQRDSDTRRRHAVFKRRRASAGSRSSDLHQSHHRGFETMGSDAAETPRAQATLHR